MPSFASPFTASRLQVATYLLGVALFSISFLVFLNSTISFVVTDVIGRTDDVGNVVGTLGFADELVVVVMCPIWGLLSDKIGVRAVVSTGYFIIGLSLFASVQASNVYPQLLLARMFFSLGAAATATMVTAILPTMTIRKPGLTRAAPMHVHESFSDEPEIESFAPSTSAVESEASPEEPVFPLKVGHSRSTTSQVAGLVGLFTGLGALLALGVFLPLPAHLAKTGRSGAQSLVLSYYIVGSIAFAVCFLCLFGLVKLSGEEHKGWRQLFGGSARDRRSTPATKCTSRLTGNVVQRLFRAITLGFLDASIGLGYLGGFVARASSVAITLFIPLFVNAYFIRSGLCAKDPGEISDPSDVKAHCRSAYTRAAALSGVSQVVALLAAPVFGWLDGRYHQHSNAPLLVAACTGIVGYAVLANVDNPDYKSSPRPSTLWICMVLLGLSQIGAIVCSLSSLARGIKSEENDTTDPTARSSISAESDPSEAEAIDEESTILRNGHPQQDATSGTIPAQRTELQGAIAGVYSLSGGAGILLLTKLGGVLFDKISPGTPFAILAGFNAILLLTGLTNGIASNWQRISAKSD